MWSLDNLFLRIMVVFWKIVEEKFKNYNLNVGNLKNNHGLKIKELKL